MSFFSYHEYLTAGLVSNYEIVPLTKVSTVLFLMNVKRETHFSTDILIDSTGQIDWDKNHKNNLPRFAWQRIYNI